MSQSLSPLEPFVPPTAAAPEQIAEWVDALDELPARLARIVGFLDPEQLALRYSEGGWTVAQLVHHIADSHMHALLRLQFALAEERPTIKAFDQDDWARLYTGGEAGVRPCLEFIACLHGRWTALLRSLGPGDFERELLHPEDGAMRLSTCLALYSWHGAHHLAQIEAVAQRAGWSSSKSALQSPARGTALELREVNAENVRDIIRLAVASAQRGLVANNATSIAQAAHSRVAWQRAVYAGGVPVGYALLHIEPEKPDYGLWRFMIGAEHQGKGFGAAALILLIEHVRGLGAAKFNLSHDQEPGHPGPFYRSFGFEYTGEVREGEREMSLQLTVD